MLEIKTITENTSFHFDHEVNKALSEGWELLRRECYITGSDRATTFYAELERIVDDAEDEEEEFEVDLPRWIVTRNPRNPYRCSSCGYMAKEQWSFCPDCKQIMAAAEE